MFTWVPFLKELGLKVLDYQDEQPLLVNLLREAGIEQGLQDQYKNTEFPLEEVDPFTFASLIFKYGKDEKRTHIFRYLQKELGIKADLPQDYYGVPKANAMSSWFFGYKDKRKSDDIEVLWQVAAGALDHSITPELWDRAINIFKCGRAKLTQAMFWYHPDSHFPVDAQTTPYLTSLGFEVNVTSWGSYQELLRQVKERINKPFFQISHDAWASNQPPVNKTYSVQLTEGAIRNGYISIYAACDIFEKDHFGGKDATQAGKEFTLLLPNGDSVQTDIRQQSPGNGGRIRSRFNALFSELSLNPGAQALIRKTDDGQYTLSFANVAPPVEEIRINRELLALAVARTIRPYLIEKNMLQEDNLEGYQHNQIIPKAQPLLTRASLESDPINSVKNAVKAAQNLLSQYEHARPLPFLDQCDPDEARKNFIDLIHGDGPLIDRVSRFVDWADWNKHKKDGNKIGFNATIISYLLCVSQPKSYAFCKPENYQMAARALLGSDQVEQNQIKRIDHTTRFYQAVLKILQEEHHLPLTDLMHVHITFWLLKNWGDGVPSWDDLLKTSEVNERPTMKNLNTILYGPPGTGKTFHTARLAVEIIDGSAPQERTELMARYHQLTDAGRISFVTFHQSFSYEEFIEGIRPVLNTDNEEATVTYELSDGIFKQACQIAQGLGHSFAGGSSLEPSSKIWKISLGDSQNPNDAHIYRDCIEQGQIAIGFVDDIDFEQCDDRTSIVKALESQGHELVKNDYTPIAINCFKNSIRKDDIVVVSDGNLKFKAIGKVVGDYQFDPDYTYPHKRKVEWIRIFNESLPYGQLMNKRFSQMTLYSLNEPSIKLDALKALLAPSQAFSRETVIIIDEINRGNISKIFGELITLIENDKRLDAVNRLRARLPYSGEEFGIPSNLHVIGTMNTADRSLAHIDTALRRRFKFIEVMPDESLLSTVNWGGKIVDIPQLLKTINHRIEVLFDREHTIGHSYFMDGQGKTVDAQNLPHTFQHKIIPLLTEYFFEDWSKVRAILADDQVDDPDLQFVTAKEIEDGLINIKIKKPKAYRINITALTNPDAYIKIYSSKNNSSG